MAKIACFHLYNDYSGSPKVLRNVVEGLLSKKHDITMITSHTHGVLDELRDNANIEYDYFNYRIFKNKIVWMLAIIRAQMCLFFKALKHRDCSVFYINTIMPWGAAVAGKLLRKKVVYHYHENAFIKSHFYRMLYRMMLFMADEIICVSEFQRSFLPQSNHISVVYNALPASFTGKLTPDVYKAYGERNVLMVSSLVLYKGPIEFIQLAKKLCKYRFTLVLNETQNAINSFVSSHNLEIPDNVRIYPRQSDVSLFYNAASILLNLSDKNRVIETFGMTALEGMSAGLPVIVPTVGGIAELVDDGVNGFKIDVSQLDVIAEKIDYLLSDIEVYSRLASGALSTASLYSSEHMCDEIELILKR